MANENFTTYELVNGRLTITISKIKAVNTEDNINDYVYKDFTADYFDALDVDFEAYVNSTSDESGVEMVSFTNLIHSFQSFATTDLSVHIYFSSGTTIGITLMRGYAAAYDYNNTDCHTNTPYYLTFSRSAGNDTVVFYIYSDATRLILIDTLTISGFGTVKWRYTYGFMGETGLHSDRSFTGYVQNMNITGANEDFTTYIEVNGLGAGGLTVTASKVNAVNNEDSVAAYVYKDFTANYFDALNTFFEGYVSDTSDDSGSEAIAVSNTIGPWTTFTSTDVALSNSMSGTNAGFELIRGNEVAYDYNISAYLNTLMYFTLSRVAGNDTINLYIYTDSGRTSLVDTLTVSGFGITKWRYLYGFVNAFKGYTVRSFTGYIQNMNLNEVTSTLIKSIDGLAKSLIKSVNGRDIASVKSFNSLT